MLRKAAVLGFAMGTALVFSIFAFLCTVDAKQSFGDTPAYVVQVHDGDTIKVSIPGFPPILGHNIGVRVYGVDTRELKTGAVAAKTFVQTQLPIGSKVFLVGMMRDKYFRILSSVKYNCEELGPKCLDLGSVLVEKGFAVPYFGGKKVEFPPEVK